jgi:AdoMet-dependent heme synthase
MRHPDELTTQEAGDLARQIASFGRPRPIFVVTGGDPFARDDLFDIVRNAASEGLPVAVSPSGTPRLTADNLVALRDAGASAISLSLDGSTAALHDGFRGVDGVLAATLRAWDAARECGLRVQINTTVTRHNLDDLPSIVKMVAERGAMTWSAFVLVPTGRGRALQSLDASTVEDVLNFVYDAGVFVAAKTTEAPHFRRVVVQRAILERRQLDPVATLKLGPLYRRLTAELENAMAGFPRRTRRSPMDVNAGRGFVFISHTGAVHPSGFLPIAAANVRTTPLPTIYREAPLFVRLRDVEQLEGRCRDCEFAPICGGSRSRAYGVDGNPFAEEPWCSYEPGSFPYQTDLTPYLS